MAKYGPSSAFLLVGGKDLRGADTLELSETLESLLEETRGLGDSWDAHLPIGVGRITLDAGGGFYDDRVAGIVDALQAKGETLQIVDYGLVGHAAPYGQDCVLLNGTYAAIWKRIAQRAGLTKANASHRITAAYKRGKILHGLQSETAATGNTEGANSVDNGAATTGGATGHSHIPALTLGGYTSVTVKNRHSTDDVTYVDLITFAAVTAVGASEEKTVAGTINRHLAMSWVFNGAGSGQSFTPYMALSRD